MFTFLNVTRCPPYQRESESNRVLLGLLKCIFPRVGGGGYLITSNTGVHANIWGLKFYVNQYLGSVNDNMDKIHYLGSTNPKKGRIVEFGVGLQNIGLNIWDPQNVRLNI